jgi:ADP-ribosylglycohydrolase
MNFNWWKDIRINKDLKEVDDGVIITEHRIRSALFGLSVGDALGVPFEFKSRQLMRIYPATDMSGHGTYNLPSGTFSDDSSLSFCLAESLRGAMCLMLVFPQLKR